MYKYNFVCVHVYHFQFYKVVILQRPAQKGSTTPT